MGKMTSYFMSICDFCGRAGDVKKAPISGRITLWPAFFSPVWEHYKAYGEHHHKTLNYGEHIKTFDPRMREHIKTFDPRMHHPFGLDSQNLFISISFLMTENLRTISNDCLHMFSILLLSLKLKLATQLEDHEVIGRLSCQTIGG